MKKLFLILCSVLLSIPVFSQENDATLTVFGTGSTEEEAIQQALRSALEQTYGAFISANTTILNDELIKDEIVSISTGNIKNYVKHTVTPLSNGQFSVSLTATVSINKLISYAQSKGVKVDFNGHMYATNIKLLRLKIQSIQKALDLMLTQLESISKDLYRFELQIENPVRYNSPIFGDIYYFDCKITTLLDVGSVNFWKLYNETMYNCELSTEEISFCLAENIDIYDTRGNKILDEYYDKEISRESMMAEIGYEQLRKLPTHIKAEEYVFHGVQLSKHVLPITREKWKEINDRILNVARDAAYKYVIYEIGNLENSFLHILNPKKETYYGVEVKDGNSSPSQDAPYLFYSYQHEEFLMDHDVYPIQIDYLYSSYEYKYKNNENVDVDFRTIFIPAEDISTFKGFAIEILE